jgi:hypothetical protein
LLRLSFFQKTDDDEDDDDIKKGFAWSKAWKRIKSWRVEWEEIKKF